MISGSGTSLKAMAYQNGDAKCFVRKGGAS